jgi:hypothetical protein
MRWIVLVAAVTVVASAFSAVASEDAVLSNARFSIACILSSEPGPALAVPVSVLETLASEDAMQTVRFYSGDAGSRLQVEFVFADLPAFTKWYQSDAAVRLLEILEDASVEPLETKLEATAARPEMSQQ